MDQPDLQGEVGSMKGLQRDHPPLIVASHAFNHKQTPAASSLGCKVKAEQRVAGIRAINLLPKDHGQDSELFINGWYPSVDRFDGRLSTRECSRSYV